MAKADTRAFNRNIRLSLTPEVKDLLKNVFNGLKERDPNLSVYLFTYLCPVALQTLDPVSKCNSDCACGYVKYSPVCAEDGKTTFISACHAGCRHSARINNTDFFLDCTCISRNDSTPYLHSSIAYEESQNGYAKSGNCQVDCLSKFYVFLVVVCVLKFSGATGRASNFLVTVRCVEEKDKPVAMGFGLMLMSLCAFVPSPILFGIILDKACLVWGKTCTGNGNCWLYNGKTLRYTMNFTAAVFVLVGTLFDAGVWYYVKGLKIFDEEIEDIELDLPR